jgi:GR25 family glycosyltransferase involved in LPS biosynthesis
MNQIKDFKAYFINLKRRHDRLQRFEANFRKANFDFTAERFEAIDGRDLVANDELLWLLRENDFEDAASVLGCALSHITLWKQLINDSTCSYYLIFEDDVFFPDDVVINFKRALKELPSDFSIFYLGGSQPGVRYSKSLATVAEDVGYGLHGYLISKETAILILKKIEERGLYCAIDMLLLDYVPQLKGYVAAPWLAYQKFYAEDSDINEINTPIKKPEEAI